MKRMLENVSSYELTNKKITDLAEEYHVSYSTVWSEINRRGIVNITKNTSKTYSITKQEYEEFSLNELCTIKNAPYTAVVKHAMVNYGLTKEDLKSLNKRRKERAKRVMVDSIPDEEFKKPVREIGKKYKLSNAFILEERTRRGINCSKKTKLSTISEEELFSSSPKELMNKYNVSMNTVYIERRKRNEQNV